MTRPLDKLEAGMRGTNGAIIGPFYLFGGKGRLDNTPIWFKPLDITNPRLATLRCGFRTDFEVSGMPVLMFGSEGLADAIAMQMEIAATNDVWSWNIDTTQKVPIYYESPNKGTMIAMSDTGAPGAQGSSRLHVLCGNTDSTAWWSTPNPGAKNGAHPTLQFIPSGHADTKFCNIYYDGTHLIAIKEDGTTANLL